jgi:hypothetical protein
MSRFTILAFPDAAALTQREGEVCVREERARERARARDRERERRT